MLIVIVYVLTDLSDKTQNKKSPISLTRIILWYSILIVTNELLNCEIVLAEVSLMKYVHVVGNCGRKQVI